MWPARGAVSVPLEFTAAATMLGLTGADAPAPFVPCAVIHFDATVDGNPGQGDVRAFGCELRTDEGGNQFYFCPIGSED